MPLTATPPVDPHWRARLAEIQDLLLVAHEVDDVVRAFLSLTNILADEWGRQEDDRAQQLVREALDVFLNPESPINVRDWIRAAQAVVGTPAPVDRRALMQEIRGDET